MTVRTRAFGFRITMSSLCIAIAGCGANGPSQEASEGEPAPELLGQTQQPLYSTGTLWTTSRTALRDGAVSNTDKITYLPGQIPVCFETGLDERFQTGFLGNTAIVPNFATFKSWFVDAVENSYARAANIQFKYYSSCPSRNDQDMNGWIAVYWREGPTSCGAGWPDQVSCGANTDIGYRSAWWTRMGLSRPADTSAASKDYFQKTVRHEMGHALGFEHEVDRPDAPHGGGLSCAYGASKPGSYWTEVVDAASIMNWSYCPEADAGVLSPYDIYGLQKAYGRKPSKSVLGLGGRCVNVNGGTYTDGATLISYDCHGYSNDTWNRWVTGNANGDEVFYQVLNPGTQYATSWAMAEHSPNNPSGTTFVELKYYTGVTPRNTWRMSGVTWRAIGDLCVGVRGDGRLEFQTCNGNLTQFWDWDYGGVAGRIRQTYSNPPQCANVYYASNAVGTPITLFPCGSPAYSNEVFQTTSMGELRYGGRCVSGNMGNNPIPGSALQISDCTPAGAPRTSWWFDQLFFIRGRVRNAGSTNSLGIYNATQANGTPIETFPAVSGATNQQWDIYF